MTIFTREPFSMPVSKSKIITSASTSQQIMRIPWADPANKSVQIRRAILTNTASGASNLVTTVTLWDQDLSNTTAPTTGSAGGALLTFAMGGASGTAASAIIDMLAMPEVNFQAGIAAQSSAINVSIALELDVL